MAPGWRVLALGVAFFGGCVCMFLYMYSAHNQTAEQSWFDDPSWNTIQNLNQNRNRNGDPKQTRDTASKPKGTNNQNQKGTVELPVVKGVLQKTGFGKNWKVDKDLQTLRNYGVVENIPAPEVLDTYDVNKLSAIYHSLSNFRAMLNHTDRIIDVIKMDVERAEWSALPTMLKERQLDNVRQLLIEYHHPKDEVTTLRSHLKVLRDLERVGFKKFYVSKNRACTRSALGIPIKRTSCYEVHYVNAKFQRIRKSD